jgi:LAO/AO transport system kinase
MQASVTLLQQLTDPDLPGPQRRMALGRAITLVESERPADRTLANALIEQSLPLAGRSLRLGVTGIPGVGKSTLIDALGMELIDRGHRVAVLAVDPSSARSGGSILGDKTRMERLSLSDAAFIRPTATGGDLGGVARRTRETIALCEAAGFDRILVETVGVGQSELEVDRMTDLTLLLMIAGAGDELQGIKRGIMEAADLIALTKSDTDTDNKGRAAVNDLRNAIGLLPPRPSGRQPEVLVTSAVSGQGIAGLCDRIEQLHAADTESGYLRQRRQDQDLHWLRRSVQDGMMLALQNDDRVQAAWALLETDVSAGRRSPSSAAEELIALFRTGGAPLP